MLFGRLVVDRADGFIQRCGSSRRYAIPVGDPADVAATAAKVVLSRQQVNRRGGRNPYQLEGRFLPSIRRLTVALPAKVGYPAAIAVSSKHLYLVADDGDLWQAPAPTLRPGF
jgi:hypothetical protein